MPWAMSYLLEDHPYWGHKWPTNEQDVTTERPDPNHPDFDTIPNYWRKPTNPSDPGPWTIQNYWQYTYEPKVLGAFSSRRVQMWPEDLVNYPPFGNVKVNTPTYPGSYWGGHFRTPIKVHMGPIPIYVSPHLPLWKAVQMEKRGEAICFTEDDRKWIKKQSSLTPIYITPEDNPWGPRVRRVSPGWLQHMESISADDVRSFIYDDMREVSTQLNKARRERWAEKLPKPKKEPSKDLFS